MGVKEVEAPRALGVSIQYAVSESAHIVLQTHVGIDTPKEDFDAVLDAAFRACDRQKARYQIEGIEESIRKSATLIKNAEQDIQRVDADFNVRMMGREADMEAFADRLQKVQEEDQSAFHASGRKGTWVASTHAKSQVASITSAVEKHKEETARMKAERDVALRDHGIIMGRHNENMASLLRQLGAAKALVG